MKQTWLELFDGLELEIREAREEGKHPNAALEARVRAALALPDGPEKRERARELFEETRALPCANESAEPNDLDAIRAARGQSLPPQTPDGGALFDKTYGGWLGRAAGCLLGKPVEGWRRKELYALLKNTGNYPIDRYLRSDAPEDVWAKVRAARGEENFPYLLASFVDKTNCMPEDDDTNYTLIALKLLETYGRAFTSGDVGECWLKNLPILHTCTAERVAYRNLVMGLCPPESAAFCNGYREWIGAQIRADLFGYVNPGDPASAAEMAWRDARVSHVKNGIYGEMWVAAMIAAAYSLRDIEAILRAGLNELPRRSRFVSAIERVIGWKKENVGWEEAVSRIHREWDERDAHHWCHVLSNAQIVAAALLFGEKDFGRTLGIAVTAAFDTDCNGATAGSVLGVLLGARALPDAWVAPLNDTLLSGVDGFGRVQLSDMARRTVALIK